MAKLEFSLNHRYIINETIQNGKISFYKAMDTNFQRYVGIKEICLADNNGHATFEKFKNIAQNEINALARVGDMTVRVPCLLETFYDKKDAKIFIVMQWIDGIELTKKMQSANESQFIQWMIDLCDILAIMDKRNIHHKDIKPANIMIDKANQMHLIDFNLSITKPDLTSGTINYLAPEMKSNFANSFTKSDMFSIGVIMYEFFTKRLPVEGNEYVLKTSRLIKKKNENAWTRFEEPKTINPNISDELNNIIVKCMSRSPDDRFENYFILKKELLSARRMLKNGRS